MLSFTRFDVFIILVLMAVPYLMGGVILFLLVRSFRHSGSRILLLWLVLPQFLATLLVWWGLNFYNVDTTAFSILLSASVATLGGIVICSLLFRVLKPVTGGLLLGHLAALALFFVVINTLNPRLYTELQTGRDMHQLRDIGQSSEEFNRRLEDSESRQEMLFEAVDHGGMPEATFRGLLARGANPFQKYALNGSIFSVAVKRHNLNALRVFSEQLDGDDEQAKNNRTFLRKNNPLDQPFRFSITPTEEQNQQYKATVKVILDKMPELLSDEVYASILSEANTELIQFLWGYHPPEKPVYRIQAEALLGMLTVADKIAAAPGMLKEKAAADYPVSLWEYLVKYAPRPVIQSVLERNVVQWADYKDTKGNNPVLEEAIGRAEKYTGDDPQVLTIVMRDILAHRASWSPSQLAHGFYTDEEGSHVVSALHKAGITCTQLREALSNFLDGHTIEDGKQRIEEVCGVKK
ncbi:TPA: hypothetical protein ACQ30S_004217 [Yersinia enterocolitica]